MKMEKMTSYLAWAVGLLSLPLYALLFVMMRSGDWVYHEVLTPLTYVTLLTQILCLFFYRISAHAFSNSLFEGDICFENLEKIVQEFLFMAGSFVCFISTSFLSLFLSEVLVLQLFNTALPLSLELPISILATIFFFGFLPKIIVDYYRHLFEKIFPGGFPVCR